MIWDKIIYIFSVQIVPLIQITWIICKKMWTALNYTGISHFLTVFCRACLFAW